MKISLIIFLISGNVFAKGAKRAEEFQISSSFENDSYSQCTNNVLDQLEKMRKKPRKYKSFNVSYGVFKRLNYRMNLFNKNTLGLDNHFQGLAKLNGSNNYIISGGDYKRKEGHLFIINNGRVIKKMSTGRGNLWHPGGISVAGDVLAIPNQAYKTEGPDFIQLYDIKDPKNPKELLIFESKIGAGISLHRRKNDGKYLLIAGSGLLISKTSNILDGFGSWKSFPKKMKTSGQSQSILEDCKTKELFLVTFDNISKAAPIIYGKDILTLYKINLSKPSVSKIKDFKFKCGWMKCNFDAGAALYIENDKIKIRATHHYRQWYGRTISTGEFY